MSTTSVILGVTVVALLALAVLFVRLVKKHMDLQQQVEQNTANINTMHNANLQAWTQQTDINTSFIGQHDLARYNLENLIKDRIEQGDKFMHPRSPHLH